jgi:hypothetical protein
MQFRAGRSALPSRSTSLRRPGCLSSIRTPPPRIREAEAKAAREQEQASVKNSQPVNEHTLMSRPRSSVTSQAAVIASIHPYCHQWQQQQHEQPRESTRGQTIDSSLSLL